MGTLSRKVLRTGPIGSYGVEEVELPSGRRATLDVLVHPGAAAAIVFKTATTIVMLKQYRHAVGEWLWEIPAGKLDPGESAAECIAREIEEETGLRASSIEPLGVIVPTPAYTTERLWLFEASGTTAGTQAHGADEEIEIHDMEFADALAMIRRGEIIDAKTIAALHLAAAQRR
jgi:ADP-ribose pyrophosphatase